MERRNIVEEGGGRRDRQRERESDRERERERRMRGQRTMKEGTMMVVC